MSWLTGEPLFYKLAPLPFARVPLLEETYDVIWAGLCAPLRTLTTQRTQRLESHLAQLIGVHPGVQIEFGFSVDLWTEEQIVERRARITRKYVKLIVTILVILLYWLSI